MNKKTIIIFIIGLIVAFGVGFFIGDSTAIDRVNKEISQNIKETAVKGETTTKEESTGQQPAEGKKLEVVAKGTTSNIGNMDLNIVDVGEAKELNFTSGEKYNASGKFVILKLQLKNTSTAPVQYDQRIFALKDNTNIYKIDDNAFNAMGNLNSEESIMKHNAEFIGVYADFNAGISKYTYIVFDVPENTDTVNSHLVCADKQFSLK